MEEWIEMLANDGARLPKFTADTRYSGKFVIRIDPGLHRRLALNAKASGESLNSFCAKTLGKA